MIASLGLALALTVVGGHGPRTTLIRPVGDPSPGLLVNRTPGSRPFDPPDPRRPTVVFVHGLNPFPGHLRFIMAERLAGAVARRHGPSAFNLLDWDWNAATVVSVHHRTNLEAAVEQGPRLAEALRRSGLDPSRVHLIGHSNGAVLAVSAARTIASGGGTRLAQVTLLEPAAFYHDVVFDRLGAAGVASRVENIWATGPSGFGRDSTTPGVVNLRIDGRTPYLGVVWPTRSGHFDVVRWYIDSVEAPPGSPGFGASLLLGR